MTDFEPTSKHPFELTVLGQVRTYADDQVLERAWSRLEKRGQRSSRVKPVAQLLAAAALLAVGFGAGRLTENSEVAAVDAVASNELVAVAEVPAGPALEARPPRRVVRRTGGDPGAAQRAASPARSGTMARRSASPAASADADFELENAYEMAVEELAIQPSRPAWLVFADRGDFAAAFQLLDESGGFDSVLQSGSAEELMTLVDVARFVGNQGRAIQALRVVTERHQTDANAPLAAMMLGNLLSRAGDQSGASAAFALNRRLSPGGDFAEDALVREFGMAIAAFDLPTVLRLSSQYEQEFPQGSHLQELRSEAARLRQAVAVQAVAVSDRTSSTSEENPSGDNGSAQDSGSAQDNASAQEAGSGKKSSSEQSAAESQESPQLSAEPESNGSKRDGSKSSGSERAKN